MAAAVMFAGRDTPGTVRKYVSSGYVLHSFEAPTGYRFLLTASRDAGDLRPLLAELYSTVFLPHAVFNPLYEMGTEITCPRFIAGESGCGASPWRQPPPHHPRLYPPKWSVLPSPRALCPRRNRRPCVRRAILPSAIIKRVPLRCVM